MLIDFENKIFKGSNERKSLYDFKLPANAKGVIIFMHGYKGFKDWGAWGLMQQFFLEHNYGFVKFNVSHNGGTIENPIDFDDLQAFGENTYSKEIYDLNVIINETQRIISEECDLDLPIYLVGHSRGGGMVIIAGSNHSSVKGIISLAGISDIAIRFPVGEQLREWEQDGVFYVANQRTGQQMPHFYTFYSDFEQNKEILSIEDAARRISVPFLHIHGDMDLSVSISEGQKIAAWTETELKIIKGAEHNFGAKHPWQENHLPVDFKEAMTSILEFLNKID